MINLITGIPTGLSLGGQWLSNGFLRPQLSDAGAAANSGAASTGTQDASVIHRSVAVPEELQETCGLIQRGEFTGDINAVVAQLGMSIADFQRAVSTSDSAFPARENLEAPARQLVPTDTPLRNRLPRVVGAGLATAWRQLASFGGGWGAGFDQPGGGAAVRGFYAEGGSIAEVKQAYVAKTAAYKRMGFYGAITGFAAAAGASYQDQRERQRTYTLTNTMLFEEFALLNGDATSTAAPFGDGVNALSFDGLLNLVSTANGTPSGQVQSAVGALTKSHIDQQLAAIHNRGGRGLYIVMNAQEILSLTALCEQTGSLIRVQATSDGKTVLGLKVSGYVHPVSGELVDILHSRFLMPGTIIYGSTFLPDGTPALDVSVLPQAPRPDTVEKSEMIQGYAVTPLARSQADPDTDPFVITVYEVLRMQSALHFAKDTGVTAVTA